MHMCEVGWETLPVVVVDSLLIWSSHDGERRLSLLASRPEPWQYSSCPLSNLGQPRSAGH
ncbi:hypothetical protein HYC85_028734 [Camellia sinensis]|uniref:Uncharacterized protein n=1 Tax=Camellia sinensis TaxID=4442 RepID=A0A7J7FVZ6_CAMSI|nr:hypothetical protein HYC85_028734 [Camellia sinensis]